MSGFPITLSEAAKNRLRQITAQKPGVAGVRLSIARGRGCGGNEYRMEYMEEEKPGYDKVDAGGGAVLYIPVADSLYLFNTSIDFTEDELGNNRFLFANPNEAGRCGCGESFSLDKNQKMDESGACGVKGRLS